MLPGPTFFSQTDLSPKVIVCPLQFKKHNMKQGLFGRVRTGEGRYWGFFTLPTLAIAEYNPGKQKPMHKNFLAGRKKRCLVETKRAWCHSCHGRGLCRNHSFLDEQERGLGKWVASDPGAADTGQGLQCAFASVLFPSSPSHPWDSTGEEARGGCFQYLLFP